jgi:ABC-type antimicrobial peptide transport system permease subunit
MSSTIFPMKDLLRRKLQTSLTIVTLTLSVASTLFLLLFSERVGVGIASTGETLTAGLSVVLSQFLLFVGILIFAVGAVITSFIVFLMMKQRTRDFGLIKAAGCPNGLVFGYFFIELLILTVAGCVLGVVLGFAADFVVANIFGFQAYQSPLNLWFAPLVFVAFFVLAVTFGIKPMLDAARASPMKLLSPVQYYGLGAGGKFKPLSRFGLTVRIASRSLFRRQSASVRVVILLCVVFVLLTVSIAGGIIASDTTTSWVDKAIGQDVIVVAHTSMADQYKTLLLTFSGAKQNGDFNYLDSNLAVPDALLDRLNSTLEIAMVDPRLIMTGNVQEISNFTIDPDTLTTISVGDSREGESLIVGVNPRNVTSAWFTDGRFLSPEDGLEAVIGDSIAQTMFAPDPKAHVRVANPLVQSIRLQNATFRIVGVCVDPINNGRVTYIPLETLQSILNMSSPNIVFLKLASSADRSVALAQIKDAVNSVGSDFTVFELNDLTHEDVNFLGSAWSTVMLLPLLTLTSAALCLIGYMMLAADEQQREFAVLRAVGVKQNTVIAVLAVQSVVVLLSGFAVGISLGVITTLLILISHPVVTIFTILEVAAWLFTALAGMFLLSLYPAVKLAKTPILRVMG